MNLRERGLVPYYSETLNYYSPLDYGALAWFDICWPPTVLDLGCGDGRLAEHVPDGVTIVGIDCAQGRIDHAIKHRAGHVWRVGDLYDPLPREWCGIFALVCMFEILEHLAQPLEVLAQAKWARSLGGQVIASVPINSPGEHHLQLFKSIAGALEVFDPDAHQVHQVQGHVAHLLMKWTE